MKIGCVLWDFGDTLVDQDWMLRPPDNAPDWPHAWSQVARGALEEPWNLGRVTRHEVTKQVAERLAMSMDEVESHVQSCCRHVRTFAAPIAAARRCPLPQAIVTVNPDVFTDFVVPALRLDELFPLIVTSWEEGTTDKVALCELALRRLGSPCERGCALLIDNIPENVDAWRAAGGAGYVFRGEDEFSRDLDGCLEGLAASGPS